MESSQELSSFLLGYRRVQFVGVCASATRSHLLCRQKRIGSPGTVQLAAKRNLTHPIPRPATVRNAVSHSTH